MSTTSIAPKAQRGAICVLLEPSLPAKARLRRYHVQLQTIFGGTPCNEPHVTCQRFAPEDHLDIPSVINALHREFLTLKPFPLFADSLMTFYAEFWRCTVLRWRVQPTPSWVRFKSRVETVLTRQGCPPHYPPTQAITATALENISEVDARLTASEALFPFFLFNVQRIVLSQIESANQFKILASFELANAEASAIKLPSYVGFPDQ